MVDETLTEQQTATPATPPRLTRRRLLRVLAGAGAAAGVGAGGWALLSGRDGGAPASPSSGDVGTAGLDRFAEAITSGGPPKDGIPPIDEPRFVAADEADFLDGDDVVFALVHAGEARAYPQLVLVWHEIVNDTFPDGPLTVTYCPLTGSTVAFRGTAPDGEPYTFGTSGDLVNSNLLMYDRQTDSRWPQILGRAVTGPATGAQLGELPVLWTTWNRWRDAHPDTQVLSTDTGSIRNYGEDPYGSYTPLSGYYRPGSRPFFPVMHDNARFDPKEVVIGVKHGADRLAVPKGLVRERGAVMARMEGRPLAVLHDPALDDARVFVAQARGVDLELVGDHERGRFADRSSGLIFDARGRSVGRGGSVEALRQVLSYDVMWFAWVAFFPSTQVIA